MINLFTLVSEENEAIVGSMDSVGGLINEKLSVNQEDGTFDAQDFINIILESFMIGVANTPKILNSKYYGENKERMFTGIVSTSNSLVYNIVSRYELTPIFSSEHEKVCINADLPDISLSYLCIKALVERLESLDFDRAGATLH